MRWVRVRLCAIVDTLSMRRMHEFRFVQTKFYSIGYVADIPGCAHAMHGTRGMHGIHGMHGDRGILTGNPCLKGCWLGAQASCHAR